MNKFDEAFDKEPYPQVLLKKGWLSLGKMRYKFGDIVIFFDTSRQIEIYKNSEVISSHYLENSDELEKILNSI